MRIHEIHMSDRQMRTCTSVHMRRCGDNGSAKLGQRARARAKVQVQQLFLRVGQQPASEHSSSGEGGAGCLNPKGEREEQRIGGGGLLEVGAGTGYWAKYLSAKGINILPFD